MPVFEQIAGIFIYEKRSSVFVWAPSFLGFRIRENRRYSLPNLIISASAVWMDKNHFEPNNPNNKKMIYKTKPKKIPLPNVKPIFFWSLSTGYSCFLEIQAISQQVLLAIEN